MAKNGKLIARLMEELIWVIRSIISIPVGLYELFKSTDEEVGEPPVIEEHENMSPEGLKSHAVRWDLIEKREAGEAEQSGAAGRGNSARRRSPSGSGIVPARSTEAPKPFSEEARRAAVRMSLDSSDDVEPRIIDDPRAKSGFHPRPSSSDAAGLMSSGEFLARGPESFSHGQEVMVTVPKQGFTFKAQIVNVGETEVMFSTSVSEALQLDLEKGQHIILRLKSNEGKNYKFDARVAGLKGRHSTWFSVKFESMKSSTAGRTTQTQGKAVKINKPIRFCVITDENDVPQDIEALSKRSGISEPIQAILRDISETDFRLMLRTGLPKGTCVFQLPGSGSEIIDDLLMSGTVEDVKANPDKLVRDLWPFVANVKIIKSSDKLAEVLRSFSQ